ncbi:class I SAM-dependent DNA methyltransferase [Candidatus Enterococcus clewellii]|uniref:Methyltransferase domain-containing protein n=1 Tax=Candidatus Enterococcus clewellii TaxID=1834193 RepID=A0A242KDJ0_9ENTE|nr:class I SAM-dependent methyltransferase [Enterococcus sp. 9E7_DIV0242]OTP18610.1 hypothetical protein A5888_000424 [Enterococcus sp. 9E7_DIV0242]
MFIEYGELSTIMYELTKPVGSSMNGDVEYYYEQLVGTTGKILEAGVGTGRMMIPLLQKGLSIEGVDLSEQMLAQCRNNLEEAGLSAPLYQGDLTALRLENKYEAIIMPTGSFCLLPRSCVQAVLQSFFTHLEVGGRLIIDLELPSWFVAKEVETSEYPMDKESGILFTCTAQTMDWHEQKTSYIHRYELVRNGYVEKTELSNFVLYWYGIEEFTMLLKAAGFSSISYEVGYGKDPAASLLTFFAEK